MSSIVKKLTWLLCSVLKGPFCKTPYSKPLFLTGRGKIRDFNYDMDLEFNLMLILKNKILFTDFTVRKLLTNILELAAN